MVKHLPTVWETWVRSLGQEDPLEKEMATHSSIHASKIPWAEEPGGPMELQSRTSLHFIYLCTRSISFCLFKITLVIMTSIFCTIRFSFSTKSFP